MSETTEADANARHAEKMRKHQAGKAKILAGKSDEKGLLIVHTGAGKGKTSAALGMVMRHIAYDWPVGIVQFIKAPEWVTGEGEAARPLPRPRHAARDGRGLHLGHAGSRARHEGRPCGLGAGQGADPRRPPPPRPAGRAQHRAALRLPACRRGRRLPPDEKPDGKHVIVTGRNAKPELIEIADLVTEMTLVKHPFRPASRPRRASSIDVGHAPRTPALMIQGTGSNVGKSTIVAGLCRAYLRRGLTIAPFKPQNMSNNAAATADGGEIGRAQAVQARAAGRPPSVHMNPVLLKPESDTGAQVIVQGKRRGTLKARAFGERKAELMPAVLDSFARVSDGVDLVLVEGAGSPAEINLRAGDIANMGFALAAGVPVVLAGDIDRGGVIASLVGTHAVLEAEERALVRGFLVNKFRGDLRLFDGGVAAITERTGWPCFGVAPWLPEAAWLPAEDALDLARPAPGGAAGRLRIAVPVIARIANFDDLDPLGMEPGAELVLVRPGEALPGDTDLVILPGSKSTIADLAFLRGQGWDIDLLAHHRRGGRVIGLCGGYQMLGRTIADPEGVEGPAGTVPGLGLLAVDTVLTPDKITAPAAGRHLASGEAVAGYEIHLGRTEGPDTSRPLLRLDDGPPRRRREPGRTRRGNLPARPLHGRRLPGRLPDPVRPVGRPRLREPDRDRARCAGGPPGAASRPGRDAGGGAGEVNACTPYDRRYIALRYTTGETMSVAKVFWSGRSQAVRLPKEFRFDTAEVGIRRRGMQSCSNRSRMTGLGSTGSSARSTMISWPP